VTTYAAGKAPTTQYILFASSSTRYELVLKGDLNQWTTGMRLRVKAPKSAPAAASPQANGSVSISPAPVLHVTEVVVLASAAAAAPPSPTARSNSSVAATYTGPVLGVAPLNMAVLFIIITMCNQPASITPEVRGG
jgi:hypothetical protein